MSFRLNILNFFSPPVPRELKETKEQYDRVKEAYFASELSKISLEDFADTTAFGAFDAMGLDYYPKNLIGKVIEETAYVFIEDARIFEFKNVDFSRRLDFDEGVELRNYLKAKEIQLADCEKTIDQVYAVAKYILEQVLKSIPSEILSYKAEDTNDEGFSVSLIDLVDDPVSLIEEIVYPIVANETHELRVFEKYEKILDSNFILASGINPKDTSPKKEVIGPRKAKNKTPRELIDIYLAGTHFHNLLNFKIPFQIPFPARFEHCHIVGGTGHGKTQLLQSLIYQDLLKALEGKGGLCIIDSQGDLIKTISNLKIFSPQISESLAEKLILVDPNDLQYPVCLNMFDVNLDRIKSYSAVEQEKILNGTIELYEYIFGALLGAELTQKQGVIFKYLAQIMMVIPGANIHTLRELMEDGEPFRVHFSKLDGTARLFFENQFFAKTFNDTKRQIQNRLWGVLSNKIFEKMFAQERNKIDLFEAMNSGKIVLINTAKDLLKKDGCQILGRFFIAMIAQSALERSTIPPDRRKSFFVYIDEAHDYFDDNIEDLLNQARKFKVGMILAHQNLEQLSHKLRATIMSSTSIKIAGGVSSKDASTFAKEMNCEQEFIQGVKKKKSYTEFACWVRNFTDRALKITVPLGVIESLPVINKEAYQELIDRNRALYSGVVEAGQDLTKPPVEKAEGFELGEPEDLL